MRFGGGLSGHPTPRQPSQLGKASAGTRTAVPSPQPYLEGAGSAGMLGQELPQPLGTETVPGQVEEGEGRQGGQGGQQVAGHGVWQSAAAQPELPQRRLQLEGPQQWGEVGGAQGQAPLDPQPRALLLQLRQLQQQRVRFCRGGRKVSVAFGGPRGPGRGRGSLPTTRGGDVEGSLPTARLWQALRYRSARGGRSQHCTSASTCNAGAITNSTAGIAGDAQHGAGLGAHLLVALQDVPHQVLGGQESPLFLEDEPWQQPTGLVIPLGRPLRQPAHGTALAATTAGPGKGGHW